MQIVFKDGSTSRIPSNPYKATAFTKRHFRRNTDHSNSRSFGFTNAPATFQRMMNQIMQKHREFADVYLDEIIIHSRTFEKHATHIAAVLETLREEQLYAKLHKCEFSRNSIEFCGHIVSENAFPLCHQSCSQFQIGQYQTLSDVMLISRYRLQIVQEINQMEVGSRAAKIF